MWKNAVSEQEQQQGNKVAGEWTVLLLLSETFSQETARKNGKRDTPKEKLRAVQWRGAQPATGPGAPGGGTWI